MAERTESEVTEEMKESVAGLAQRIARIEEILEQVVERLNHVELRLNTLEQRMDHLQQSLETRFIWLIGIVLTTWITLMITILVKL